MIHLLTILMGCTEPAAVQGHVVDIWNNPIEGATVMVEGGDERPLTDAHGVYAMKPLTGSFKMRAGKEGYIQESMEVELTEGVKAGPSFKLYKKPEKSGFYAVTLGDYLHLVPSTVKVVGHEVDAIYGVAAPNDKQYIEGDTIKIVYRTDLAKHQLQKLGLEVRKLKFLEDTTMATVAGGQKTKVPINLFVDDGKVAHDLIKLGSKGHYLIQTTEPIEPGVYAVQAQSLLNPVDPERYKQIPEAVRSVNAFIVK